MPRAPRGTRGLASRVAVLALVAISACMWEVVAAPTASAAAPFQCDGNSVYTIEANGDVRRVQAQNGLFGPVVYNGQISNKESNSLGIGPGGTTAFNVSPSDLLVEHDALSEQDTVTPLAAAADTSAGAVDPTTGIYYYGGFEDSNTMVLYGYDPVADRSFGPAARITFAGSDGSGPDIAFDATGRLYVFERTRVGQKSVATLFTMDAALPTSGATAVSLQANSGLVLKNLNRKVRITGFAFGSDGYAYLSSTGFIYRVDVTSGHVGVPLQFIGSTGLLATVNDLASCASPSLLRVQASFPDGRISASDQVQTTVSGGSYGDDRPTGQDHRPTGATTGDEAGVQDQSPAEYAGPALVLPRTTYRVDALGTAGTNLGQYLTSYECVDRARGNAVIASGKGIAARLTPPEPSGADIVCTMTAAKPRAEIDVAAEVAPATYGRAGQVLTYTLTVANAGNVLLTTLGVSGDLSGLSGVDCGPTVPGGTLGVGATTTCTATYTVTQDDVDADRALTSTFRATGTPPAIFGLRPAEGSDIATATAVPRPTATDDVALTPFHTPVRLPAVGNDSAGTPSVELVPAETVLLDDGTLPPGSEAAQDGKQLTVPGEGVWRLDPSTGEATFSPASAFTGTTTPVPYRIADSNGRTDVATLTVTVQPGPAATPDIATTSQNAPVEVDPLAGDGPDTAGLNADGSPGTLDPTSVQLVETSNLPDGSEASADGKTLTVSGEGVYTVEPTSGVVTFDPEAQFTGQATPVTYTAQDTVATSDGTTVHNPVESTITVTVIAVPAPLAAADEVTTPYGTPARIRVLANDEPGDPSAPLDPTSVELVGPSGTTPAPDGKSLTVPDQGGFTVDATSGVVTFTPVDGFTGSVTQVGYTVADSHGIVARATIDVTVAEARAGMTPDKATTQPATAIAVDVLANDEPPAGLSWEATSVCLLPTGTCVDTATVSDVGAWAVKPDGKVGFTPVKGYHGAAVIRYSVADMAGHRYSSTLTVTVPKAATPTKPSDSGDSSASGDSTSASTTSDLGLPSTGGPSRWILLGGLAAVVLGLGLMATSRRPRAV